MMTSAHTSRAASRPRRPAFTLLELVVVLALVGITAAIAVPRFASASQNYRARAAAQRLVADLAYIQSRATMTSSTLALTFSVGTGRYTVLGVTDPRTGAGIYTVDLAEPPFEAKVVSTTLAGAKRTAGAVQLRFDGYGVPSAGGSIAITAGSAAVSVSVDPVSGKGTIE
jgi:prepilin-type N-terminal cleavage/methylation domain-containing protein